MYKVKEAVLEFGHIFMLSKSTFNSMSADYNIKYLSCYELVVSQVARCMNAKGVCLITSLNFLIFE